MGGSGENASIGIMETCTVEYGRVGSSWKMLGWRREICMCQRRVAKPKLSGGCGGCITVHATGIYLHALYNLNPKKGCSITWVRLFVVETELIFV